MFAHQVIEDLLKAIELRSQVCNKDVALEICQSIRESQSFHFGVVSSICKLFVGAGPVNSFQSNGSASLMLPYKTCWFDFVAKNETVQPASKIGFLILDNPKGLIILGFYYPYSFEDKTWVPYPFIGFLYKNEVQLRLKEHPILKHKPGHWPGLEMYSKDFHLVGFGLNLLNCRNIETVKHLAPEKLNKNRKANGLTPLFTYHTLHIKVFNKKRNAFESVNPTNIHNRVHLCRGHFKKYTAEAPLFGKYTGVWWWQANIRGQNRKGIVMKDYEIDTACEARNGEAR